MEALAHDGTMTTATAAGRRAIDLTHTRYLVVANQTAGSAHLRHAILERARAHASSFHLLVPATRVQGPELALLGSEHLRSWPGEDAGFALARYRLEQATRRLRSEGIEVDGDVGPPDPLAAIIECLAAIEVDAILLSTLPRRMSRWLKSELPRRLQRVTTLPVSHLEVTPVP
jgi:hypothetical protein